MNFSFLSFSALIAFAGADPCGDKYTAATKCDADKACTWCKCSALPSACWTLANAKALPSGVYACDSKAEEASPAFAEFKRKFNKVYSSEAQEKVALATFIGNMEAAKLLNNENTTATYGMTKFMDISAADFKKMYLNRRSRGVAARNLPMWNGECTACKMFPEMANVTAADAVDWVSKGAVTKVKDQGQCGSCWSFGTTGDIEGTTFLATSKLNSLSEQQLVACDTGEDQGCNGGLQEDAFVYVEKNGLTGEADYPYTAGGGKSGRCEKAKIKAPLTKISSWVQVSKSAAGEEGIKAALAKSGPITIGINAGHLQTYKSGISDPIVCRSGEGALDHAVMIVGYGTANGEDYWKIKNSWAKDWGEEGYFRIKSGVNKCGVAVDAVHSVV